MTIRVTQRGQPYHGEAQAAYAQVYRPLTAPVIQPPVTPDYGAWAVQNNHLLSGPWLPGRPMAAPTPTVWRGLGGPQPAPTAPMMAPFPLRGMVQIQQGAPGAAHLPSQAVVVRDAMAHPHSRAPRLYGPSLGARLGDVYRW